MVEKEILIKAQDIHKTFTLGEVSVHALRGLSFEIFNGEMVVILGPSGSGKSTLLNIIGGIDTVTSGSINYSGIELNSMNEKSLSEFRREHVGFIFQFYNLMPHLTALENIELAGELSKSPLDALELIKQVDLFDRKDNYPGKMSGGQQQRVALARALGQSPQIILADEPVAALDPVTSNQVMDDFRKINKENKITILINIHDVDLALKYCDRVVGINKGRIVYDGAASDITKEILDKIYQKDLFATGE